MYLQIPTAAITDAPGPATDAVSRSQRLIAVTIDVSTGLAMCGLATAVAFAWLLAVTGVGGSEPSSFASSVAFAIVMAALPAWLAYLASSLCASREEGATWGQARTGIAVRGSRLSRGVRLAAHPVGSAGWLWTAAVASLATVPALPLLLVSLGVIVLAAGFVSAIMLTVRPGTAPLHDRIAGTIVVRR